MDRSILAVCVLLGVAGCALGHSYHLGACPVVEPMADFDMRRMLGVWYVMQKTSTASHCITYNFTRGEEPGEYQLEQVSQHFILGLTPLKHDYRYTGVLRVNDPAVPAKVTVRFPLSVAGSAAYTIVSTDYDEYAAIFTCQKITFAHRRSATILSRRPYLDRMYVEKMRNRLSSFGIDPYDLSIIVQNDCPKHPNGTTDGVNINIDPDTFSAHNVAEVVRHTGDKIADGVEYVLVNGKKVYNHLASSKEELTSESPNLSRSKLYHPETDAEWLP